MDAIQNTYTPPQGDLIDSQSGFCKPRFLALSGRIGRLRYLAYGTAIGLLTWTAIIVAGIPLLLMSGVEAAITGFSGMILLLSLPSIVFSFAFAIRRLNDMNQSGWLSLLMFVPLVNIGLSLFLIFGRGTEGTNSYGLPPPPNTKGVIALSLTLPVFIVLIGILAAITLPAYQDYANRARLQQSAIYAPDTATDTATEDTGVAEDQWSEEETSADSEAVQ